MKIYLIEKNKEKFKYLVPYFDELEDVVLINSDFRTFMNSNEIECIVSPANSYGIMDGGYDLAIINYFGRSVQDKVQEHIIKNYYGEQPVGTSFLININESQKLIHTPTMRTPDRIKDETIIYQCMRTTLLTAKQNNIKSILIPMFGGLTGGIHPNIIARMMRYAYDQVNSPQEEPNWENIRKLKQ